MTPPDSGDREVACTCVPIGDVHSIECATLAYLREPPTPYAGPPPMPDGWLAVRTDLAQRILAALENAITTAATAGYADPTDRALADELRKEMGK